MFSVGNDPGTFVGTSHLLDGEGSEECLAILSVKGHLLSTLEPMKFKRQNIL